MLIFKRSEQMCVINCVPTGALSMNIAGSALSGFATENMRGGFLFPPS
jgi:hypothetical protein